MGRRVLIVDFDVFGAIGGGQTVYKQIIRQRPQDTFYFFSGGGPVPELPDNCRTIPFYEPYADLGAETLPSQGHLMHVFRDTMNLAGSVHRALGPLFIDVVDTPDYRQNGLFLRAALGFHGIEVGEVALALHGTISSALRSAWPWQGDQDRFFAELHMRERLQYNVVDTRYALSEAYAAELQKRSSLPINLIDPLLFVGEPDPQPAEPEDRAPDLIFVGRRERRKGPDLFLDLAWCAPRESYRRLMIIGPDGVNHQGGGSGPWLDAAIRSRGEEVEILGGRSQAEINELYRAKTVSLLPSRYDQFNLVALESLLTGCPTLVSEHAGVAPFIRERLGPLSDLVIGIDCGRSGAEPLIEVLEHYERSRDRVVAAVLGANLEADTGTLDRLYGTDSASSSRARALVNDVADRFFLFSNVQLHRPLPVVRDPVLLTAGAVAVGAAGLGRLSRGAARRGRRLAAGVGDLIKGARPRLHTAAKQYLIRRYRLDEKAATQLHLIGSHAGVRARLSNDPERTDAEIGRKIGYLNQLVNERRVDRARWFRELARLERKRGQPLIAAAYDLRLLRWLPDDRFNLMDQAVTTLRDEGYAREAEAAEAMYRDPAHRHERTRAYLDDQRTRHSENRFGPFETVDDRRKSGKPKVSVIVSLYRAADKLPTFLGMLAQQTLVKQGRVELILVDSGSPQNEKAAFERFAAGGGARIPTVYARSPNRETIQSAWNRGISLSRGDYLAFYGVDEGMRPDCLEILASQLDHHPEVDWAMSDSIVTNVDRHGVTADDIMVYDRSGYRQDWHYLDSTFLSYVGGLYRRSIHDRVGYYDTSFTAAGDTEFKNRALPAISTLYVPGRLGVFNNYPEARTTNHPRAEIEDLRAWYMHRTYAGMGYAFDHRTPGEAVALLWDTLGYRKCYCGHFSTDLKLGAAVAHYLDHRFGEPHWRDNYQRYSAMLGRASDMELWSSPRGGLAASLEFARDYRIVCNQATAVSASVGSGQSRVEVFNDNTYEQHWWSWSTP